MLLTCLLNSAIGLFLLLGGSLLGVLPLFAGGLCGVVWLIENQDGGSKADQQRNAAIDVANALRRQASSYRNN